MADDHRDSETTDFERRSFLRSAEHKIGLAQGNGSGIPPVLIPLGHFALILAALFIVASEADKAGYAKARADNAYALAQEAKMEARVLQDKVEDLRLEVAKRGKP